MHNCHAIEQALPFSVRHLILERDTSIYLLPLRGFITYKNLRTTDQRHP